jgi:hypothetical protein
MNKNEAEEWADLFMKSLFPIEDLVSPDEYKTSRQLLINNMIHPFHIRNFKTYDQGYTFEMEYFDRKEFIDLVETTKSLFDTGKHYSFEIGTSNSNKTGTELTIWVYIGQGGYALSNKKSNDVTIATDKDFNIVHQDPFVKQNMKDIQAEIRKRRLEIITGGLNK